MDFHSRQALVGDIGGTYISFGIADIDELTISHFALLTTADFTSPMQAVERYLQSIPRCPDKVSFAVAGTVADDRAKMTHFPWTITRNDVRAATGAKAVTLISDIEALALSLPHLTDYDLIEVSVGKPVRDGGKVVIASGTDLAVAGLVWTGEKWMPSSGAGGQVVFPAPKAGEFDIRTLFPQADFVPASSVFSGQGLMALYRGLAASRDVQVDNLTPPQITKAGLSGGDAIAAEALELMTTWLARFAGDVALLTGAKGGVYLAGALSANIVPSFGAARFRAAFEDKGEAAAFVRDIPIKVIKMGADAGLRGAAIALARELPASRTPDRKTLSLRAT